MANCGVCSVIVEGRNARKCPTKKCNNPICLSCDPLEPESSKLVKGAKTIGTIGQLATGNISGILHKEMGKMGERVKCNSCNSKDKNQDRWIIAAVIGFFVGSFSLSTVSDFFENQLNTSISGFTIFIIIFIPILILSQKLLKIIYFPSK